MTSESLLISLESSLSLLRRTGGARNDTEGPVFDPDRGRVRNSSLPRGNCLYHKRLGPRIVHTSHMPAIRFDNPPPEPLASAPGFLLSWHGQRTAYLFSRALEPVGLLPRHFGILN